MKNNGNYKHNFENVRDRDKGKKKKQKEYLVYGTLSKFKRGFGFVEPDEDSRELLKAYVTGDERDIFISASDINGAMDGDKVEVVILPRYFWREERPEGQIKRVTERKLKEIAGTLYKTGKYGFVVPENRRIKEDVFVAAKNLMTAENGDKVVCSILKYPAENSRAEGKITEIIARKDEKGADIKALIRAYDYKEGFNSEVKRQASEIKRNGISWEQGDRRDLRDKSIFTIDGADSKDFDDAVSIDILENGNYLLGVHIADVSEYVTEDSPLDKEALARGTSVYLIDQVVPMLPEELSNDICSLMPGEDRLTLSVSMEVDGEGNVKDYEIFKSVIRSKHRMVYDDVSDIIESNGFDSELRKTETRDGHKEMPENKEGKDKESDRNNGTNDKTPNKPEYADIYRDIMNMAELACALRRKRKERGSLDFDIDEASIVLDKNGIVSEIGIAERRSANKLIEEFMLLANETVAKHFAFMELPFVYRVHEKPATDKIEELKTFMRAFGINLSVNADNVHPKLLSGILLDLHGSRYENVISTVMLRSMKKADYEPDCLGHFGLALKYYCHFTSPIRRYPDLIIHRIIKEALTEFPDAERLNILNRKVREASELSSAGERKAAELEREVEKLKKAEYMERHIGETYEGIISGVSNSGFYVELANTVEGLVKMESLTDDYYDCEPEKYRIIGRYTGRVFGLGEPVTVRVKSASKDTREIDFALLSRQSNNTTVKHEQRIEE